MSIQVTGRGRPMPPTGSAKERRFQGFRDRLKPVEKLSPQLPRSSAGIQGLRGIGFDRPGGRPGGTMRPIDGSAVRDPDSAGRSGPGARRPAQAPRLDLLAPTPADRAAGPWRKKATSLPRLRGHLVEPVGRGPQVPEAVEAGQRRRGVGRPAGEARLASGSRLMQPDPGASRSQAECDSFGACSAARTTRLSGPVGQGGVVGQRRVDPARVGSSVEGQACRTGRR